MCAWWDAAIPSLPFDFKYQIQWSSVSEALITYFVVSCSLNGLEEVKRLFILQDSLKTQGWRAVDSTLKRPCLRVMASNAWYSLFSIFMTSAGASSLEISAVKHPARTFSSYDTIEITSKNLLQSSSKAGYWVIFNWLACPDYAARGSSIWFLGVCLETRKWDTCCVFFSIHADEQYIGHVSSKWGLVVAKYML